MTDERIPEPAVDEAQLAHADELIAKVDDLGRDAVAALRDGHFAKAGELVTVPPPWITPEERRRRFVAEVVAAVEASIAMESEYYNHESWGRIISAYGIAARTRK